MVRYYHTQRGSVFESRSRSSPFSLTALATHRTTMRDLRAQDRRAANTNMEKSSANCQSNVEREESGLQCNLAAQARLLSPDAHPDERGVWLVRQLRVVVVYTIGVDDVPTEEEQA